MGALLSMLLGQTEATSKPPVEKLSQGKGRKHGCCSKARARRTAHNRRSQARARCRLAAGDDEGLVEGQRPDHVTGKFSRGGAVGQVGAGQDFRDGAAYAGGYATHRL